MDRLGLSKDELRRSTRGRKGFALFTALLWLLAFIFILLVNVGQVRNQSPMNQWYFFRFDVSHIVPQSTEEASLINSFAKSIGLHDFYDVGMWNYCEGYFDQGITDCSTPQVLYWFNPVAILQQQLLRGAQISLPSEVIGYLHIVQVASQVMFGCFFAGVMACFVSIFLAPLALYSKLLTIPVAIFSFLTTAAVVIGAGISTGIWTVLQMELQKFASEINVVADLGVSMFVFQWLGAGFAMTAMIVQICLMCCCTSRRDVKVKYRRTKGSTDQEMEQAY